MPEYEKSRKDLEQVIAGKGQNLLKILDEYKKMKQPKSTVLQMSL